MVKMKVKTKTYEVPVSVMRRWKLTPADSTLILLSLMNFSSKHVELERRRKSLLHRMRGDFFIVLYAPGCENGHEKKQEETAEIKTPNEPVQKSLL
jgi:hypothetical protein